MVKTQIKIKELYQSQRKGLNQPVSFALMATALSSCGGGGGGSGSTTQNINYTGAVVKGPLQNALVFLDTNGNNIKDASEVSVLTDAKGNYSFSAPSGSYNLIATTTSNTIDTSSGEILDGVTFKAPKSSSIISPITTVMVETGLSKEKVSESLGIAGVDILTFNPFDDGVDEQKALSMEKVSHQTLLTINAISSAAKDSGIDEDKAFELGMSAFSKKIMEINNTSSSTVIDLSNESTIDDFITVAKTVIKDAGGDENIFQQVSETLGDNVKTNNKKISDLKDMDSTDAKTAFANSAKITKLVEDAIKELNLPTVTTPSADECVSVDVASPTVTPATPTSSSLCIDEVSTTSPTTTPTTSTSSTTTTTSTSSPTTTTTPASPTTTTSSSTSTTTATTVSTETVTSSPTSGVKVDKLIGTSTDDSLWFKEGALLESPGGIEFPDYVIDGKGGYDFLNLGNHSVEISRDDWLLNVEEIVSLPAVTIILNNQTENLIIKANLYSHRWEESLDYKMNTIISSGSGSDWIWSSWGDDTIIGGGGDDYITNSMGSDTFTGGAGSDIFFIASVDEKVDTITDFSISDGDKLYFNAKGGIVEESKALDFMTDDGGGNTQIKWGSGMEQVNLILTGVSTSELSGYDFLIPASELP